MADARTDAVAPEAPRAKPAQAGWALWADNHLETKDKSATVPSSDFCFKKLHRLFCQGEVFGYKEDGKTPKPVDYNNPSKYRDYEQCKAELK